MSFIIICINLVWFLCSMVYQPFCVVYCQSHSWRIVVLFKPITGQMEERVHTFPKGMSPNVNLIVRLEFELAYYVVAVQHMSHYTTSCRNIYRINKKYIFFTSKGLGNCINKFKYLLQYIMIKNNSPFFLLV